MGLVGHDALDGVGHDRVATHNDGALPEEGEDVPQKRHPHAEGDDLDRVEALEQPQGLHVPRLQLSGEVDPYEVRVPAARRRRPELKHVSPAGFRDRIHRAS